MGPTLWQISLKNILLFENKSRFDRQRFISQKCVPLSRTKYKAHFISSTGQICWRDIPENIKKCHSKKNILYSISKIFMSLELNLLLHQTKILSDKQKEQVSKFVTCTKVSE